MRFAQLVMGPAGCGKTTYCSTMIAHALASHRRMQIVNLDPDAEYFEEYDDHKLYKEHIIADIMELICLDDVMEDDEISLGPNGGLVFCMETLVDNLDWLQEQLGEDEDDYILFDCPGQIELYTHLDVIAKLVEALHKWNFNVCAIYILDATFLVEPSKFFSGVLSALATMVNVPIPHVNVLSKMDLMSKSAKKAIESYLDPDLDILLTAEPSDDKWMQKHQRLAEAIAKIVDDYSLVKLIPLQKDNEESVEELLLYIDNSIQYGEELDVKTREFEDQDIQEHEPDDGYNSRE